MLKKPLSIFLAMLLLFGIAAIGVAAEPYEPATYTIGNVSGITANPAYTVAQNVVNQVPVKYTVLQPGDIVCFQRNAKLTVAYYPDADSLSKRDVSNSFFLDERFNFWLDDDNKKIYTSNKYENILASSEGQYKSFRDIIDKVNPDNILNPNRTYVIKDIGDMSNAYDSALYNHGENAIDYSCNKTVNSISVQGEFLGWVIDTAKTSSSSNTLYLYALWGNKPDSIQYTVKYQNSAGEDVSNPVIKNGLEGEVVTEEAIEITDLVATETSKSITLAKGQDNVIVFTYDPVFVGGLDKVKLWIREISFVKDLLNKELFEGFTVSTILDMNIPSLLSAVAGILKTMLKLDAIFEAIGIGEEV